jgi:ribosome-associated protein
MIAITPRIHIRDEELQESFIRASGPGGQNVNKVATAVALRFDALASMSLPDDMKARLRRLAGARMTASGVLVIRSDRHRSQERNRADALAKLVALLRSAAEKPKPRRPTKPTRASKEKRLQRKGRRSRIKKLRGARHDEA